MSGPLGRLNLFSKTGRTDGYLLPLPATSPHDGTSQSSEHLQNVYQCVKLRQQEQMTSSVRRFRSDPVVPEKEFEWETHRGRVSSSFRSRRIVEEIGQGFERYS